MLDAVYEMRLRDAKNGVTITGQPFDERYFNYYLNATARGLKVKALDPAVYNSRRNGAGVCIYQIDKNASPLFMPGVNTAVLFISHVVNDETIFRYGMLKTACGALGYSLYWAMDENAETSMNTPPPGADVYRFSHERYASEMPFAVYKTRQEAYLNAASAAALMFWKDNVRKYGRIWIVEHDACLAGKWEDFFRKYSDPSIDFAVDDVTTSCDWDKWYHYRHVNKKDLMDECLAENVLAKSLNCVCMLSDRLINSIYKFLKSRGDGSVFYEWVWPTVAVKMKYSIARFKSNNFTVHEIPDDFADFRPGAPYHKIKLDVSWKSVMDRRGIALA